jgi:hypothetical protein
MNANTEALIEQRFAINVVIVGEEKQLLRENDGNGAVLYFETEEEASTYAGIEAMTEIFDEKVTLEVVRVEVRKDFSTVTEDSPQGEWSAMIRAIKTGHKIKISEDVYYYFLEVLPPREMFKGGFMFAEGYDYLERFTHEKEGYFAQRTDKMNTRD